MGHPPSSRIVAAVMRSVRLRIWLRGVGCRRTRAPSWHPCAPMPGRVPPRRRVRWVSGARPPARAARPPPAAGPPPGPSSTRRSPLAGRGSGARAPIDPARVPMPPPYRGPARAAGSPPAPAAPGACVPSRASAPSAPPSRPASVRFRSRIHTHRDHAPGEPPVNDASPVRGGRRGAGREYGRAATTPRAGGADRAGGPRSTGLPALVQGGAGRGRTGRSGTPVGAASRTRSPASPPSAQEPRRAAGEARAGSPVRSPRPAPA